MRKRADGLWEARYTDPLTDKICSVYAKTQGGALAKRKGALASAEGRSPESYEGFSDFLRRWLEGPVRISVKPLTYHRYETVVRLHLVPTLGDVPLEDLTRAHFQRLYGEKLGAGFSPRLVNLVHVVARSALKTAVSWGLLPKNPTDGAVPPKATGRAINPLTREEVGKVLKVLDGYRMGTLFEVAVFSGLRAGELVGLKWPDVDWESRTLRISRQLIRLPADGGREYAFAEPKRAGSKRAVKVPPRVVDALLRRREEEIAEGNRDAECVFLREDGSYIDASMLSRDYLRPLLRRAGVDPIGHTFHDLRHTFASLLLLGGTHAKVVQEMLGHASIVITLNTYSHLLPGLQEGAADSLGGLFDGS
ncbi:MAG: site-specific integrase [Actinomycetota bacterium]|nr:site-specific integrase [Actinomycetota bacterium]